MKKEFDYMNLFQRTYENMLEGIVTTRKNAKALHSAGNIKASGDEVEEKVRDFIKTLIPENYYIEQGHIIDKNMQGSKQWDIIIAGKEFSKPLKFGGDTHHFFYETVFAIGEIKTSFCKQHIIDCINDIKNIKTNMQRDKTKPNEFSDFSLDVGLSTNDARSYKNPLFTFMVFVESNENNLEKIIHEIYKSESAQYLPNLILFLNKGILCRVGSVNNELTQISTTSEFEKPSAENKIFWEWGIIHDKIENKTKDITSTIVFQAILTTHLNGCILKNPNYISYASNVFSQITVNLLEP